MWRTLARSALRRPLLRTAQLYCRIPTPYWTCTRPSSPVASRWPRESRRLRTIWRGRSIDMDGDTRGTCRVAPASPQAFRLRTKARLRHADAQFQAVLTKLLRFERCRQGATLYVRNVPRPPDFGCKRALVVLMAHTELLSTLEFGCVTRPTA